MFVQYSLRHPEFLTETQFLEGFGFYAHNASLNNISSAKFAEDMEEVKKAFELLRSYKRSKQTPQQLLTSDILDYYLEKRIFSQQFPHYEFPIDHINGVQVQLPLFLHQAHQINNLRDAENYLNRLAGIRTKIDQTIEDIMIKEIFEAVPPKFMLDCMITQIDLFLSDSIQNNFIYKDFTNKISENEALTPDAKNELLYEAKVEIEENVYRAFHDLKIKLEVLKDNANKDVGVWKNSDGDTYYYNQTGEHMTLDTPLFIIQDWATEEINLLQDEAKQLITESGYSFHPDSSFCHIMKKVGANFKFKAKNKEKLKKEILSKFEDLNLVFQKKQKQLFESQFDISCQVEFMDRIFEKFWGLSYYYPGSLTDKRKATLFLNLELFRESPSYLLPVIGIIEIFPGYHFQRSISNAQEDLPKFRKFMEFSSFKEGWQNYAMDLALKNDLVEDPMVQLGLIQWKLLYAAKAIIDIDIHTNQFTREQAIGFVKQVTGLPTPIVKAEVDKCLAYPGKAPAFLPGKKRIQEFCLQNREREQHPGEAEIALLKQGNIPLRILDKYQSFK
ncbi:DUF885 family protein [Flexithrix dorotheae]|uniref:DUF885 family protein n=1 Tax=Flexithrix dorotheae TaxID=70993 RepID=UPI0012F76444|nr:DUF885 domain-containing protein [Flexithrix dorotheae]